MSGLVPDNPDVDAAYWLQRLGGTPVIAQWRAQSATWWIPPWHISVTPGSAHAIGYTFAYGDPTHVRVRQNDD